jgi:hypothetical protein
MIKMRKYVVVRHFTTWDTIEVMAKNNAEAILDAQSVCEVCRSEIMENLEPCEDKDTAKLITGKVRI